MPEASRAGRGAAAIALAKVYFVLAGFGVQFALPRLFGSAARYGLYQSVMVGVSILNNLMIAATVQTVAKLVSEDEASAPATVRRALAIQLGVGLLGAGGLSLAAGPLAARMYDPNYASMVRIASVVVLAYALYATLVGALNGRQRFVAQAGFDAGFTTLRTVGLCVGAALFGVAGAVSGFAAAAVTITLAAVVVVGIGGRVEGREAPPLARFLRYMAPVWLYQALLNMLLQLDTLLIKGQITRMAVASGVAVAAAVEQADVLTGYYKAAQNFAFVPYQLVLTATLVVFPMVSKATSSGDDEAARAAIRGAARFSLLALLLMAAPIAGAADGVLRLMYPPEYVAGAAVLRILAPSLVAFALFSLAATVLAGAGRPGVAAGVAGLAVACMVALDVIALRIAGPRTLALTALSLGTGSAMVIAATVAITLVHRRFGAFVPFGTVVRAVPAALVAFGVAHFTPHEGKLMALVAVAAGGVAYLGVLLVLGELTDLLAGLRERLARRKAAR